MVQQYIILTYKYRKCYYTFMRLRNISISESNYEILRNLGKAGESFNDVISQLVKKIYITENTRLNDSDQKLRSEERPGNHTQTAASSANSDT